MKFSPRIILLTGFLFGALSPAGWSSKPPAKKSKAHSAKKAKVTVTKKTKPPVADAETQALAPLIPSVAKLSKKHAQTSIKIQPDKPDTDKDAALDEAVMEDPKMAISWPYLEKR